MCARCEELEERVAWLEGELGLQREAWAVDTLRAAFAASPNRRAGSRLGAARLVLALYRAKGRPMTTYQLMEACPPTDRREDERSSNIVSVWAYFARQVLGKDAVASAWGQGYRLSEKGLSQVAAILAEPTRFQVAA